MSMMKKLLVYAVTATAAIAMTLVSASACTGIYVGSANTEDGSTYFARSEDISNSYNKVFYVSPAGNHKAGDTYEGCYGWSYTFTKDSYSYTAFRDDNLGGVCPDCGQEHDHTPYEAAGTNSKGVTVTATVTVGGNSEVKAVDPTDDGIEEAEIPTVLLSEAATAREAVDLLLSIYDEDGTQGGNGVFIADQTETWYVENTTGHQYIALKLPDDLIFVSPNMSILGEIDLDDENVIASEDLIKVAQDAGTFVGDADENIIDFRASYARLSTGSRMWNGLNYLNSSYNYTEETITDDDFTVSNVKDGKIVSAYSAIEADRKITVQDMVDFYKVDGIGNTSNLDYHIFSISATGTPELATTEWVGMDHGKYGVMVPYFPMLTTDTYEGYQVSTDEAEFVTEEPTDGSAYYPYTNRKGVSGYMVLPEGWEDSVYWSVDALANAIVYGECTEEQEQFILDNLAAIQDSCYATYEFLQELLPELLEEDPADAAEVSTISSAYLAEISHQMTLALYDYVTEGTADSVDALYYDLFLGENPIIALSDETLGDLELIEDYSFLNAAASKPQATETVVGPNGGKFDVEINVVKDVASSAWYGEAVRLVEQLGIFNGYEDGTFQPEAQMTRAMVATVLWRLDGSPEPEKATTAFTDVEAGAWYADAVAWASENGVTNGKTATTFDPDTAITREEFVTMLYRYVALYDEETSGEALAQDAFTDLADLSSYAQEPMAWAVENGLVNGYEDGSLKPQADIQRCEAAKILAAFFQ
jgi:dipeptidase